MQKSTMPSYRQDDPGDRMSHKVVLTGLSKDMSERLLTRYFNKKTSSLKNIQIVRKSEVDNNCGCALMTLASESDFKRILEQKSFIIKGRIIIAKEKLSSGQLTDFRKEFTRRSRARKEGFKGDPDREAQLYVYSGGEVNQDFDKGDRWLDGGVYDQPEKSFRKSSRNKIVKIYSKKGEIRRKNLISGRKDSRRMVVDRGGNFVRSRGEKHFKCKAYFNENHEYGGRGEGHEGYFGDNDPIYFWRSDRRRARKVPHAGEESYRTKRRKAIQGRMKYTDVDFDHQNDDDWYDEAPYDYEEDYDYHHRHHRDRGYSGHEDSDWHQHKNRPYYCYKDYFEYGEQRADHDYLERSRKKNYGYQYRHRDKLHAEKDFLDEEASQEQYELYLEDYGKAPRRHRHKSYHLPREGSSRGSQYNLKQHSRKGRRRTIQTAQTKGRGFQEYLSDNDIDDDTANNGITAKIDKDGLTRKPSSDEKNQSPGNKNNSGSNESSNAQDNNLQELSKSQTEQRTKFPRDVEEDPCNPKDGRKGSECLEGEKNHPKRKKKKKKNKQKNSNKKRTKNHPNPELNVKGLSKKHKKLLKNSEDRQLSNIDEIISKSKFENEGKRFYFDGENRWFQLNSESDEQKSEEADHDSDSIAPKQKNMIFEPELLGKGENDHLDQKFRLLEDNSTQKLPHDHYWHYSEEEEEKYGKQGWFEFSKNVGSSVIFKHLTNKQKESLVSSQQPQRDKKNGNYEVNFGAIEQILEAPEKDLIGENGVELMNPNTKGLKLANKTLSTDYSNKVRSLMQDHPPFSEHSIANQMTSVGPKNHQTSNTPADQKEQQNQDSKDLPQQQEDIFKISPSISRANENEKPAGQQTIIRNRPEEETNGASQDQTPNQPTQFNEMNGHRPSEQNQAPSNSQPQEQEQEQQEEQGTVTIEGSRLNFGATHISIVNNISVVNPSENIRSLSQNENLEAEEEPAESVESRHLPWLFDIGFNHEEVNFRINYHSVGGGRIELF